MIVFRYQFHLYEQYNVNAFWIKSLVNHNNNIYNILNFKKGLFSRFNKKLTAFEWQVVNIKTKIKYIINYYN